MSNHCLSILVEGSDAADSSEAAASLREQILNRSIEKNVQGIEIQMTRSDPNAQDVSGDILEIAHTGVITGLFIVETIKLWRESRRDKALIIEAKHGSGVRIELSHVDAPKKLEKAILEGAQSSEAM
jgi:hypothetical protein